MAAITGAVRGIYLRRPTLKDSETISLGTRRWTSQQPTYNGTNCFFLSRRATGKAWGNGLLGSSTSVTRYT
ncbi:hypothetical protein MPTK1_4g02770 [Marchantia polymorpha subsp. ruderalis]|uniref:Uncharacterized protein n=2 Tax=Marchantia polymorpha TaxID=3197 RepID=A0AAF6B5M2_MARPO|nr:hypothetical protein MARPO_0080s0022 [Marchantia polymorpha]BBN07306.1 hypothetical protein Mp_4g02770 [Marchantia polymorpha subsp. ruderalis]|eukprot:PTQ34398.1 hypothetical protein MARPO_0080s0022 [Marchantia polymorpha]